MDRINSVGTILDQYGHRIRQDMNLQTGAPGTELSSAYDNSVQEELIGGLIEATGLTPSATNVRQIQAAIWTMIQRQTSRFAVDSSTAPNVITLDFTPAITQFFDGQEIFFRVANDGATVTATVPAPTINGVSLVSPIGVLVGTELIEGAIYSAVYSAVQNVFVLGFCGTGSLAGPFAPLAGNANQPFSVGPATQPNQAPQLQQIINVADADSYGGGNLTINPTALKTIVILGPSGATITIAPPYAAGAEIEIRGSGLTGDPTTVVVLEGQVIWLPDNSSANSITIPASFGAGLHMYADGADGNWRTVVYGQAIGLPATGSNQYTTLGQMVGRLLNIQVFAQSGTYTPTAGTTSIVVEFQASGGGSGLMTGAGANMSGASGAGGSGGWVRARFTNGFLGGLPVTIGDGGTGGENVGNWNGNQGGATAFGSLISAAGGFGGTYGTPTGGAMNASPGGGRACSDR